MQTDGTEVSVLLSWTHGVTGKLMKHMSFFVILIVPPYDKGFKIKLYKIVFFMAITGFPTNQK